MFRPLLVMFILGGLSSLAIAQPPVQEFSGRSQQMTATFEARSPWMVTWQTRHGEDDPVLGRFEVHLHDGATDEFLGVVALRYGSGTGDVLVEQSGRFRFRVLGFSDSWTLRVRSITQEQADRAKADRELARLSAAPRLSATRAQIGTIRAWRVEPGPVLIIEAADGRSFRAVFPAGCPGLEATESLRMISGAGRDWEHYSGVLLDDGRTCDFGQVLVEPAVPPR